MRGDGDMHDGGDGGCCSSRLVVYVPSMRQREREDDVGFTRAHTNTH